MGYEGLKKFFFKLWTKRNSARWTMNQQNIHMILAVSQIQKLIKITHFKKIFPIKRLTQPTELSEDLIILYSESSSDYSEMFGVGLLHPAEMII